MYAIKDDISAPRSSYGMFVVETYIGDGVVDLVVEYEPPEKGEAQRFGKGGRISWGTPDYPSECTVCEAWLCDSKDNRIMEIKLPHRLLDIDENDILQTIEDYISDQNDEMESFDDYLIDDYDERGVDNECLCCFIAIIR